MDLGKGDNMLQFVFQGDATGNNVENEWSRRENN